MTAGSPSGISRQSILGIPEDVAAVRVEAARALAEMGLASLELGEMADELDGGVALPTSEVLQAGVERIVRQPGRGGEDVFMHDRV